MPRPRTPSTLPATLAALAAALLPAVAAPQAAASPQMPASFVAPNFDLVFIGVAEAHEAGAYLARTRGTAAAWYNGAGIADQPRTAVAVNVRGLDVGTVALPYSSAGSSTQFTAVSVIPAFVGVVLGPELVDWRDVRIAISAAEQTAWSALAWWGDTDATGHWSYVSDSSLSSYVLTGTVAWAVSPRLRLGGSLGVGFTRLYENDHLSALSTADEQGTLRTRLLSGLVFHFLPAVSVQWEPVTWLAVGGAVRAPGLRLWSKSTFQGESQDTTAASSRNTFVQTGSGEFDYRYPLELDAGIAFRQERWDVELDARYHASSGTYQLLGTSVPVNTVTLPPGGTPTQSPFTPIQYAGRAVVDLALGGSWAASHAVRLHGGVYLSPSPVAAGSTFFRQTDLYGARAGVSVRGQQLSGSVGLGYETGLSSASPAASPGGAAALDDQVRVQQLSVVIAFEFET